MSLPASPIVEVSFVIPCHKSTTSLTRLVSDLVKVARRQEVKFEIVLVQDSTDRHTGQLLSSLVDSFRETRVVRLSRNFGQQAATVAGILESVGDVVVTLDDDYQHLPSDAIKLAARLLAEPALHLLYGRPRKASDSRERTLGGKLFRRSLKLAGLSFAEALSPFRAFRGCFRDAFVLSGGPTVAVDVVLSWVVDKVETVACDFNERSVGSSGYSRRDLLRLALAILVTYTTGPLRAGIYLGLLGVVGSVLAAFTILGLYFLGDISVPGFASTTLLVLWLASVQLFVIGLIGVYVGQLHQRAMRPPLYFVLGRDDSGGRKSPVAGERESNPVGGHYSS